MTKVGGTIVYSTCSMNPIENEAIVAEVLRLAETYSPGSLEIFDAQERVKGLKTRKGMLSWPVMVKKKLEEGEELPEDPKLDDLFTTFDAFPEGEVA